MFSKKKVKKPEEKGAVFKLWGLDCRDKFSLERHIDWAHKVQSPVAISL